MNNDISLPCLIPDYIPVNLNRDEIAVFDADAAISETKSRVIGRTGSYGGGTMRIAKGLSIHTGSSSSRPIYGDVNTQFPGRLVITTQRVIFAGTQKGFEFPLNKIAVFNVSNGTLSIQSGRSVFAINLSAPYLAQTAFNGVYNSILPLEIECNNTSDYQSKSDNYINQSNIDNMDGHKFEYFCADLLRKNGFSDVSVTPGSGDQGVDILAEKEGIKYAIQCKNYTSKLSNTPVQEVNAGKTFYRCHVGVVMTNSTFTPGAKELAKATGVLLWDRKVIEKMIGANTEKFVYNKQEVSNISRYFECFENLQNQEYILTHTKKVKTPLIKFPQTFLICAIVALIVISSIVISTTTKVKNKANDKGPVTLDTLQIADHPMLYDSYDEVKEYYRYYQKVELRGSLNNDDENADILYFSSSHDFDYIYDINIYFENLDEDDRNNLDLNEVLRITKSYVPNELGQYYDFVLAAQYDKIPNKYVPAAHTYICYYALNELGKNEKQNNITKYEDHLSVIIEDRDGQYYASLSGYWNGYDDYFQKYDKDFLKNISIGVQGVQTR